jgi:putative acetyltransferase
VTYRLRRFRAEDAEALARLTQSAIATIGPRAYSSEQTFAWAARHMAPQRFRDRDARGHAIIVAADDADAPVAYALLEPDGHLDQLYCHPEHSRRSLADRLLDEAEALAREGGIERLFTEASVLARPAFERAGYRMLDRRDFVIKHAGMRVPIHNYAMEKRLR